MCVKVGKAHIAFSDQQGGHKIKVFRNVLFRFLQLQKQLRADSVSMGNTPCATLAIAKTRLIMCKLEAQHLRTYSVAHLPFQAQIHARYLWSCSISAPFCVLHIHIHPRFLSEASTVCRGRLRFGNGRSGPVSAPW